MNYAAAPEIELKPLPRIVGMTQRVFEQHLPQAVFRLDTGDLVAMKFTTQRLPNNSVACTIMAWLVDEQGDPQAAIDDPGHDDPILVEFPHTAPPEQILAMGIEGVARELRDVVFGAQVTSAYFPGGAENDPVIGLSKEVRDSINIRYAIAMARAAGGTVDLVTL